MGTFAIRDGVFLSSFPLSALPYFMAGAALLAVPMAPLSGRAMARFGPVRVVPALVVANTLMFLAEYALLGRAPRAVSVLLYVHSGVLGGVTLSSFWSLLNERYDPHSAKALLARVAAAAPMGGLAGGVGAERVAALWSQGALLLILGLVSVALLAGVVALGRETPAARSRRPAEPERLSGWGQIRRQTLLRDLALVVLLAAFLRVVADYVLKAEAVAHFGRGPGLVRFFGLFYAGTALLSVLIQVTSGSFALGRLGLGGSVATHPALVGVAAAVGLVVPFPWRGLVPRVVDSGLANSLYRAGYELLYTPIAEETKRSAKPLVDVACDSAGKVLGAGLVLLLARVVPGGGLLAVNVAVLVTAAAEFHVASRLKAGYVRALEGGLRRGDVEQAAQYSLTDFTAVGSMAGLDREAIRRALEADAPASAPPEDPVLAALADFRSGDLGRARAALERLPREPVVIGALVPLLAHDQLVRQVVSALVSFGPRAAGEMASALLDPATPDVVRRRLPPALRSCPSPIARDGLVAGLSLPAFEVRLRCGRALLALTDEHPDLIVPFPGALGSVEAELQVEAEPRLLREHVFNLLALAFEREPVRIASRAFDTEDAYIRGTALEYLETILPARVFSALRPRLAVPTSAAPQRPRPTDEVRAELIRAGATMTVSLEELRRQLDAAARDES